MARKPFLKRRILPTSSRHFNNNNNNGKKGGGDDDENKPLDLHMRHAIMSANNLYEMSLNLTIPDYTAKNNASVSAPATRKAAIVQDLNKTATETTNAIRGAATSFASRMYQFLTLDHDPSPNLQLNQRLKDVKLDDLLKFMMSDRDIWTDFGHQLLRSRVITTMGVNEVMHKYISERRDLLQWKYYVEMERRKKEEAEAKANEMKPSVSATALNALTSAFRRASTSPAVATMGNTAAAGQGAGKNEEWVIPNSGASSGGAAATNGVAAVFQNILRSHRNEDEGDNGNRRPGFDFGLRRNRDRDGESKTDPTPSDDTTPPPRFDTAIPSSTEEKKESPDLRPEFYRRLSSRDVVTTMPMLKEASREASFSSTISQKSDSSRSIGSSSTTKNYYGLLRPGDIVPEPPVATPPGSSGRLERMGKGVVVHPDRSHRTLRGRSVASAPHLSQGSYKNGSFASHANASFPMANANASFPKATALPPTTTDSSITAVTPQMSSNHGTLPPVTTTDNQLITTTPPAIVPPGSSTPLDIFTTPSVAVAGKKLKLAPHLTNPTPPTARTTPRQTNQPLPTKPLGVASLIRDRRRHMADIFLPRSNAKSAKMDMVTEMLVTNGRRRRNNYQTNAASLPASKTETMAVVDVERRQTAPPSLAEVASVIAASKPIPRPLSRPGQQQRRVGSAVTNRRIQDIHYKQRRNSLNRQTTPKTNEHVVERRKNEHNMERDCHIDDYLFNKKVREMRNYRNSSSKQGRRLSNDDCQQQQEEETKGSRLTRVRSEPSLCSYASDEEPAKEERRRTTKDATSSSSPMTKESSLRRRSSVDQLLLSAKDVVDGVLGGFTQEE